MKAFFKTVIRMFKSNWSRFLANFFVVFLSIAICSGLGGLPSIYKRSMEDCFNETNINEITIKCTNSKGFNNEIVKKLDDILEIENTSLSFVNDFKMKDEKLNKELIYRLTILDFKENRKSTGVDKLTLKDTSSRNIYKKEEVVIKTPNQNLVNYNLNDTINLKFQVSESYQASYDCKIVGYVYDSYYNCVMPEVSYLNEEGKTDLSVDCFVYMDYNYTCSDYILKNFPMTDLNIKLKNKYSYFDSNYKGYVDDVVSQIKSILGEDEYKYLTLNENTGFRMFDEYMNKIQVISYLFPAFFVAVCLLVCLITLSRLIDEERSILACYESLGIQKYKVYLKYISFGFLSSLLGSVGGVIFGIKLIPNVVFAPVQAIFDLKSIRLEFDYQLGLIVSAIIVVFSCVLIFGLIFSNLKQTPASLFTGKASKPGKKILLEKIPFIWNKLSFKYKSSIRNIVRNKKNGILTILSIIGSYILLFLGLSLLDITNALREDPLYGQVADSIKLVSIVIVLFSLSMCIIIIFNITNLNILERNRELATLKVLGYTDLECSLYTFREVLMVSIVALILSIPCGYLVGYYAFSYLNFGSINDVKWYMYLASVSLIFFLTLGVNLLLYPKIKKVDMNDSLKTLE